MIRAAETFEGAERNWGERRTGTIKQLKYSNSIWIAIMAVDMFLELEGVKGESVDKVHKDKIDILAWSWGLVQHRHAPSRERRWRRQGDLPGHLDHQVHRRGLSPNLMLFCANGKHFAKGKIIVRKAGENPLEYSGHRVRRK